MLPFFILLLFLSTVTADCPSGSVYYSQLSTCYFFMTTSTEFYDAESSCNTLGGNLASIPDSFANDFIYRQAISAFPSTDYFHIGISCTSGNCSWIDGSPFSYNDFIKSAYLDGCGSMSIMNGGYWYTEKCSYERPFVCQVSSAPTTSSKPTSLCPSDDWYYFNETNSCYYWASSSDWATAESLCVDLDAHLASVHSDKELYFLKFIYNGYVWVGLHTDDNPIQFNSLWKWTDGSNLDYLPYIGLPSIGSNYTCVVYATYGFGYSNCSQNYTGICKKPSTKIISTTNPPFIPKCPVGWTYYEQTDACYMGPTKRMTQVEAEKYCISNGGHISSVHSEDEMKFLFYATSSVSSWVGLYATDNPLQLNTTWKWTDKTLVDYLPWLLGIYKLNDNLCAITAYNETNPYTYAFQNVDCTESYSAVCKQPSIDNSMSTSIPLSSTTTVKPPSPCDNIWRFSDNSYNYFIPLVTMNWTTIEEYCEFCGGYLTSIHSYDEVHNIVDTVYNSGPSELRYGYLWTGFYSQNGGRTWKWNDGSSFDYSYWMSGYPQQDGSPCGNLYLSSYIDYYFELSGMNNEQNCSKSLYGICKYH